MGLPSGISISWQSRLEPASPQLPTDGIDGTSSHGDEVSRYWANPKTLECLGYDIKAVAQPNGTYLVTFGPLTPSQLHLPPGNWHMLPAAIVRLQKQSGAGMLSPSICWKARRPDRKSLTIFALAGTAMPVQARTKVLA